MDDDKRLEEAATTVESYDKYLITFGDSFHRQLLTYQKGYS
jgi:hypothetical protein